MTIATTVKAGQLTSEHIGRKVEVTWEHGLVTSTVTDKLVRFTNQGATVTMFFERTAFRSPALLGTAPDEGLNVNSEDAVTFEVSA